MRGFHPVPRIDPRELSTDIVRSVIAQVEPLPLADVNLLHAIAAETHPTRVQAPRSGHIDRNGAIRRDSKGQLVEVPVEVSPAGRTPWRFYAAWGASEHPSDTDLQHIKLRGVFSGAITTRSVKWTRYIEYDERDKHLPRERRRIVVDMLMVTEVAPLIVDQMGIGELWFVLSAAARRQLLGG